MESYQLYYVPMLNAAVNKLRQEEFESHKQAADALNRIIRSFIAGMRVCTKGPTSANRFCYRCGTYNSSQKGKKRTGTQCETGTGVEACQWSVHMAKKENGKWAIDRCKDFAVHSLYYLCYTTRSSTAEVAEAAEMTRGEYAAFCALNKMPAVCQDTVRHHVHREKNAVKDFLLKQLGEQARQYPINESLW